MPMMGGYGYGPGALIMLLFFVFVVAGIVWLVLTLTQKQGRGEEGRSPALRILDERFARGEIDQEDYRARRAAIEERAR